MMRKEEIGTRDDSLDSTFPEESKEFKPVIKSILFAPEKAAHQEHLGVYL